MFLIPGLLLVLSRAVVEIRSRLEGLVVFDRHFFAYAVVFVSVQKYLFLIDADYLEIPNQYRAVSNSGFESTRDNLTTTDFTTTNRVAVGNSSNYSVVPSTNLTQNCT